MGELIPICHEEMVPGDIFDINASMIIRCQPLVAPVLHQVDVSVYYFFCPYRLLWEDWEDFITGGPDGTLEPVLPRWRPNRDAAVGESTLWDYFGMPTLGAFPTCSLDNYPLAFPPRAYAQVFNEYFRDQTLQAEIDFANYTGYGDDTLDFPLVSNWKKDYFTSALLWQQRGTAPALPIVGSTKAVWQQDTFRNDGTSPIAALQAYQGTQTPGRLYINDAAGIINARKAFNDNTVDLSTASPLSIADIRVSFQVQRFLERNARAGVRYTEFLKAQFGGVSPRDDRLDRPEYVGGMKAPIIFSEVLQTSETDTTPQGNLAGHGLSVNATPIGKYRAQEFGILIGIMRVMPEPSYQQGINRQWLRKTKYDYYFPVFANLSEQEIYRGEIYWKGNDTDDQTVFGFCGAYDEMRVKNNMVHGAFRSTYDYWHLGRQFGSAPALNEEFIKCVPRKDIFAVPTEPGLLVQYGNIIKALRPMPIIAEPGLIDNN